MSWQYKPYAGVMARAHWFESGARLSLCGRVQHSDEWIDDRGGMRDDCRACERRIMREAER